LLYVTVTIIAVVMITIMTVIINRLNSLFVNELSTTGSEWPVTELPPIPTATVSRQT
jgi:hypothetical protein